MQLLQTICNALISVLGFFYAYRMIYVAVGLFRTRKFAPSQTFYKYGVVISARNEEAVLGNLLDSIARQDYPQDKITVFVVADNCQDRTAQIAREHGARCYERFDAQHQTKGYAMQFLFQNIDRDFGIQSFDGFFMFDADNLLKRDYISRMNDAFASGEKIITSYRNTKNLDDGCIAAGYALHWLRTARFESSGRSFFRLSTRVQGCGFLFASELVKNGWNYVSLLEDRAFTNDAVAAGIHIAYQSRAEFYDEQPATLKIAMRQRTRWAKGQLQAVGDYGIPLFRGIFHGRGWRQKVNCYDMLLMTIPYNLALIPIKVLKFIAIAGLCLAGSTLGKELPGLALTAFQLLVFEHFGTIPMALMLFITERRRLIKIKWYKVLYYSLMFPLFGIIGDITALIAVFRRVTWQPIPHDADVNIAELEKSI